MRRGLVFLSILAIPLAVAPGATANRPIREISIQEDVVITDQCAFPVLGHIDGSEIITTFTDRAGNPIRQIGVFPHNTSTLTNLESGESITVVATGPFHAQAEPDGSVSVEASGHSFFLPNPITGEPGIWYLAGGRVATTYDAEGNVTSVDARGNLVNLCVLLAS